jgi:hypothetical protein
VRPVQPDGSVEEGVLAELVELTHPERTKRLIERIYPPGRLRSPQRGLLFQPTKCGAESTIHRGIAAKIAATARSRRRDG